MGMRQNEPGDERQVAEWLRGLALSAAQNDLDRTMSRCSRSLTGWWHRRHAAFLVGAIAELETRG